MNHRPHILIIYTGGTIGMIEDPQSHTLQPFDFSHLMAAVPKVKMLNYDIDSLQLNPPIDSSNITPEHWSEIAHAIEKNYYSCQGFVVLHGTDTMAYTASALSFMLENLRKPVIITGSQLPIGEVRTDGEENLITALQVAAATVPATGEPMVQEVAILFENHLWRGNRSTKMSATGFNAFQSYNYPELAHIGLGITFNTDALYRMPSTRPLKVRDRMDADKVMFIKLYPGIPSSTMSHLLATPGIKGVVLETYGAGNSPSDEWFISLIRKATDAGVVIVNVTQCLNGGVNDSLYETGNALAQAGVISGHDITSEAAITKLMYLLGMGLDSEGVKRYMSLDLCGEVTL